jgi:hypothetical protein
MVLGIVVAGATGGDVGRPAYAEHAPAAPASPASREEPASREAPRARRAPRAAPRAPERRAAAPPPAAGVVRAPRHRSAARVARDPIYLTHCTLLR